MKRKENDPNMNKLSNLLGIAALLLPAGLTLLRWFAPGRLPWWLWGTGVVFGVWGLAWLSDEIYYHHALQALNDFKGGPPPNEMIEAATSDTSFSIVRSDGFIFGPVLALPCLLIHGVTGLFARRAHRNPTIIRP